MPGFRERYASSSAGVATCAGMAAYDTRVAEVRVRTERRTQLVDITSRVEGALDGAADASAVLVFVPHTTAALT